MSLALRRWQSEHLLSSGQHFRLKIFLILKRFFFLFFLGLHLRHMEVSGGPIGAAGHSHSNMGRIQATSETYTTGHGNARSLIQWPRPGIKLSSSWILVGFLTHWAIMGTPLRDFFFFSFFGGPNQRHMDVPRLRVESELQLLVYTTATVTQDLSRIWDLHHNL